ncbi:hypothetical protein CFSAN000509_001346 [Salmonella bongori CFSAN000509]|nr:hypothetical protein [Salmonella bongori CFSAN000509]
MALSLRKMCLSAFLANKKALRLFFQENIFSYQLYNQIISDIILPVIDYLYAMSCEE